MQVHSLNKCKYRNAFRNWFCYSAVSSLLFSWHPDVLYVSRLCITMMMNKEVYVAAYLDGSSSLHICFHIPCDHVVSETDSVLFPVDRSWKKEENTKQSALGIFSVVAHGFVWEVICQITTLIFHCFCKRNSLNAVLGSMEAYSSYTCYFYIYLEMVSVLVIAGLSLWCLWVSKVDQKSLYRSLAFLPSTCSLLCHLWLCNFCLNYSHLLVETWHFLLHWTHLSY